MTYFNPAPIIAELKSRGFVFDGAIDMQTPETLARLAVDAAPQIVTSANGGIPTYLNTYVDPELVRVAFAPNKAVQIVGEEVQKGDWVTPTAVFPQVENTGEVSSYGDFNENGVTGVNATFPQRQNYVYQTMVQYGDREGEEYALARVNLANEKRLSATTVLNKFQNSSYFYGVANLENYGLLNDPSLSAALTPGNGTWTSATSGTTIYDDVLTMFAELQTQTQGLVEMTDKLVLVMHPTTLPNLLKLATVGSTTATGVTTNVIDLLKKAFPALRIETAVQYLSGSTYSVQLFAEELEGVRSAICAYSEKLRAHRIVQETTSFKQKFSQGTFGTIIRRPLAFTIMSGV